jgi:hypothetical protein
VSVGRMLIIEDDVAVANLLRLRIRVGSQSLPLEDSNVSLIYR